MSGRARISFVAMLGACAAGAVLALGMAASATQDAAAQEVWAATQQGLDNFVKMDRAAFEAALTDDLVAYDLDLEGKPVRMGSKADAIAYFEAISAEVKKLGGTMNVDIHSHRCSAGESLGFCAVEMDFRVKMPDGTVNSQPSYISCVLRKTPGGWKWAFWHTSLSVLPAAPAP